MAPLTIHKVLQMALIISITNKTLLTVFGGCGFVHHFYTLSHIT
jgi:hypothetical protein